MADEDRAIKDLPLTEMVNDDDDIVIEDSTPVTYRIKASTLSDYFAATSLLDKLDGTAATYKKVMREWFVTRGAEGADPETLTTLCESWYRSTRDDWCGWTEFAQPDKGSTGSDGTKGGDNAGLTVTPSTDVAANQDDYAGLPLFACVDVNWEVDADTKQPLITAIDGITTNFKRTDPEMFVGVMQMSGWVFQKEQDDTYIRGYAANRNNNYDDIAPLPECVNPDGTFREFMVHTKYMAGKVNNKMTACSGVIPWTYQSHNNWQTNAKAIGSQYSGSTTADMSFLEIMQNIKYGSLTLDGIIQGCCSMNYQYAAEVAETGAKRVVLSTANAANLEVGMSCLVGNYAGNVDRGQAAMYSITGNTGAVITDIYTILVNGSEYSAVDLDVDGTFDTAANGAEVEGTTYLSSFHWPTGATDGVLGNDGSPISNTSGKYPGKIQGVEFMSGCYETLTDVILNMYYDGDDCYYEPNIVRSSANQTTSITDNYEATGQTCIDTVTSASWQYIKKKSYKKGVLFPETLGGSSSTYHKNGFYQAIPAAQTREWLACGNLGNGVANAGLSALLGYTALSTSYWYYGSRLSPNGNRGEWTA